MLDRLIRDAEFGRFISGEESSEEVQRRRRAVSRLLSVSGHRYKIHADGRKVWFKGGRVSRIENEPILQESGQVSRRDTTEMLYDEHGNLTSYRTETRNADGERLCVQWAGRYGPSPGGKYQLQGYIETRWDALGNASRLERSQVRWDPAGRAAAYRETETDPWGRQTVREMSGIRYDSNGRPTSYRERIIGSDGGTQERWRVETRYDRLDGREEAVSFYREIRGTADGGGDEVEWSAEKYDRLGRVRAWTEKTTDSSGGVTLCRRSDIEFDRNGNVTGFEENENGPAGSRRRIWSDGVYDRWGRVVSYREIIVGGDQNVHRRWGGAEYNAKNELLSFAEELTDARGRTTQSRWKALEYQTGFVRDYQETTRVDDGGEVSHRWRGRHDAGGRVTGFVDERIDPEGNREVSERNGITYDRAGRLAGFHEARTDNFGNKTIRTWTAQRYDAYDRVLDYEEMETGAFGEERKRVWKNAQYDAQGRLASYEEDVRVDDRWIQRRWRADAYDSFGQVTVFHEETSDPLCDETFRYWQGRYDREGRLVFSREENVEGTGGKTFVEWSARSFDPRGRVTAYREVFDGGLGRSVKEWSGSYDDRGRLAASREEREDVSGMRTITDLKQIQYDSRGRMTDSFQTLRCSDRPSLFTEVRLRGRSYNEQGQVTAGIEETMIFGRDEGHEINFVITKKIEDVRQGAGGLIACVERTETVGVDDAGRSIRREERSEIKYDDGLTRQRNIQRAYGEDGAVGLETIREVRCLERARDLQGRVVLQRDEITDDAAPSEKMIVVRRNFWGAEGTLDGYEELSESRGQTVRRRVSETAYDAAGRLVAGKETVVRPESASVRTETRKSKISYDIFGRAVSWEENTEIFGPGLAHSMRSVKESTFDECGRTVSQSEEIHRGGDVFLKRSDYHAFDGFGRAVSFSETGSDENGPFQTTRSGIRYDSFGRVSGYVEEGISSGAWKKRTWAVLEFDERDREQRTMEEGFGDSGSYRLETEIEGVNTLGQTTGRLEKGWSAAEGDFERRFSDMRYDSAGRVQEYDLLKRAVGEKTVSHWGGLGYDEKGRSLGYMEVGDVWENGEFARRFENQWRVRGFSSENGMVSDSEQIEYREYRGGEIEKQIRTRKNAAYDPLGRLTGYEDTETSERTEAGETQTATVLRRRENIGYYESSGRDGGLWPGRVKGYQETLVDRTAVHHVTQTRVEEIQYDADGRQTASRTFSAGKGLDDGSADEPSTAGWIEKVKKFFLKWSAVAESRVVQENVSGGFVDRPLADLTEDLPVDGFILTRRLDTRYDVQGRPTEWMEVSASAAAAEKAAVSLVQVGYQGDSRRLAFYSARQEEGTKVQHIFKDGFSYGNSAQAGSFRECVFEGDRLRFLGKEFDWRAASWEAKSCFMDELSAGRREVEGAVQITRYDDVRYDAQGQMLDSCGVRTTRGVVLVAADGEADLAVTLDQMRDDEARRIDAEIDVELDREKKSLDEAAQEVWDKKLQAM
ncbi:MAG TPA: hypothetical protein P5079_07720, partial [Elusimicrobiota bacterium]|nr:hypothetical protein [Elusimicrobiota bacterium]